METTIGVAALPFGIALALFGRKHHQKFTLAVVAAFGVWLGLMGIELLRELIESVPGDAVEIPDNEYVNYGSAAVVALILVQLAVNVYKLFGIVVGLICAVGISSVSTQLVDDMPMEATIAINVIGAVGGLYFVTPFLMDKVGILFSFVGGAMVAVGASFAIFVAGGVADCANTASTACNWAVPLAAGGTEKVVAKFVPDIWVLAVGGKVKGASTGAHSFDFANYSNYIAIGLALLFVYMGLCTGGRANTGETSETSPLLGDAEKGEKKGK
jgi:intracellular septation protein A